MALPTPDLPYIQVKFFPLKCRHPDDTDPELRLPYSGCLRRYEAFLVIR
jgi:hypothetical protein